VAELSVDFEEMLLRARGNFEEQNNILGPSTIITNYFIIIIINAYYNYNCIIHGIMITLYRMSEKDCTLFNFYLCVESGVSCTDCY
jgi:hypothetical protein